MEGKNREGYAHYAQIEVLRWLQSRCEDQMVRAWLAAERQLLENIAAPIDARGESLNNGPRYQSFLEMNPHA